MKKKILYLIIPFFIVISISTILITSNLIILSRIYYIVTYEVNFQDSEDLVEKAETFNYLQHLKTHEGYQTHNLAQFDRNYIDREFLNHIKSKITQDRLEFHLWFGYLHHFIYTFNATKESKIYFSYSNTTIFNASLYDNKEIFSVDYDDSYNNYIGSWYVNFTYIPYISNDSATIVLNNITLVKMTLKYDYLFGNLGGTFYQIVQYVVLNSNLEVIFVYIPLTRIMVA